MASIEVSRYGGREQHTCKLKLVTARLAAVMLVFVIPVGEWVPEDPITCRVILSIYVPGTYAVFARRLRVLGCIIRVLFNILYIYQLELLPGTRSPRWSSYNCVFSFSFYRHPAHLVSVLILHALLYIYMCEL